MCGIFGYHSSKNIKSSDLFKYLNKRGPDEKKVFKNKNFTFGATRLSIRDLKNGSQPFYFKKGDIYAALNGEIYNYLELKKLILSKGYKFKTECDTELIAPGYYFFGDKFFTKINGMFAISIFDNKKKQFIIARDKFGIKPLYYYHNDSDFFYSSSAKSIYNLHFFEKKINIESLVSILKNRYIKGKSHIFHGINNLAPGSILKFNQQKKVCSKKFSIETSKINKNNYRYSVEKFFDKKILNYKIADVDMCLLLSSGIDSNIILNSLHNKKLKLYNIAFSENKYDESKKIKKLLNSQQIKNLKIIQFNNRLIEQQILKTIYSFDSPICDSVIFPMYKLFQNISKKYKVTISGEGADEIFGGYYYLNFLYFYNFIKKYKLLNLSKYLLKFTNVSLLNYLVRYQGKFDKTFKSRLLKVLEKKNFTLYDFNNFISVFDDDEIKRLLLTKYAFSSKNEIREKKTKFNLKNIINDLTKNWLPNYNCYKLDQLSMDNSLEARVPFLDNVFYSVLNFMKKNLNFYNSKKILRDIFYSKTSKKISKKTAFQNYLSKRTKEGIVLFANKKIKKNLKIFNFLNFKEFLIIKQKFIKSEELVIEKQFYSLIILAIWFEKNC